MENNKDTKGFQYTYSAGEQAELKRIREKYMPHTEEEGKLERLRRLDASVTGVAQVVALTLGVLGALIFGLGMSLCMTELGELLGLQGDLSIIIGATVGVFGGVIAGISYPVYKAVVKARRKRLSGEIIRLADELLK